MNQAHGFSLNQQEGNIYASLRQELAFNQMAQAGESL